MTIEDIKTQVEAIQRGDYEHWACDPRVDYETAVGLLRQRVRTIAWQPGYKEEAYALLATLTRPVDWKETE
jgi:hypothetical protein